MRPEIRSGIVVLRRVEGGMIVEGVFRCGQAPESKMVRVCQGDFSGPEAVEATKALASLLVETLTA